MSDLGLLCTGESRPQSLLALMNKFVHAVDVMDDTVMIPNKLKDMPVESPNAVNPHKNGTVMPMNNNKAVPQKLPNDLYTYYKMLNAIKGELVRGPTAKQSGGDSEGQDTESEDSNSEEDMDDLAKQSASAFRHHLTGLLSVLSQLTDSAQYLTGRYQEELGEFPSVPPRIARPNRSGSTFSL